ncbi:MAG: hypothetical protein M1596_04275 [Firmicutes bacterium]|nr:hypothetical protein [Bacillota bacterium]
MEPSFLDTIVRNYQINGDALYVQFSADVPVRLLTRAFVLQMAHLLLNTSLRQCWDALYPYQLRSEPGPIQCPAPELRRLMVRGQTMPRDTIMVYEILQATLRPLPVKQILWRHPQSEPEPGWDEANVRWRQVDTVGKDLVLDKRVAATGAGSILVDGTGVIRDARGVQIRRWGVESRRTRNWRLLTKDRTEFTVSGADAGFGAKQPPVDVALDIPQGDLPGTGIEEGLNDFLAAIRWMRQTYDGLVIVTIINTLGEQGSGWSTENLGQWPLCVWYHHPDKKPSSSNLRDRTNIPFRRSLWPILSTRKRLTRCYRHFCPVREGGIAPL